MLDQKGSQPLSSKERLREPINNFLPVQYRSDKWDIVTIHHLLSHTSGIEDYAVIRDYYEVEKGFCLGNTVDGMMKEAMTKELNFPIQILDMPYLDK